MTTGLNDRLKLVTGQGAGGWGYVVCAERSFLLINKAILEVIEVSWRSVPFKKLEKVNKIHKIIKKNYEILFAYLHNLLT